MNHPARIVLYTNPDGHAAGLWVNGNWVGYGTDEWRQALNDINTVAVPPDHLVVLAEPPHDTSWDTPAADRQAVIEDLVQTVHRLQDRINELADHIEVKFKTDRRAIDAIESQVRSLTSYQRELNDRVATLEGKVLTVKPDPGFEPDINDYRTWQRANEAPTVYSNPQDGLNVHSITGTVVAHGPDCFWVNLDRDINGPPHQRIDCPDAELPPIGDYYTVTHRLQGA